MWLWYEFGLLDLIWFNSAVSVSVWKEELAVSEEELHLIAGCATSLVGGTGTPPNWAVHCCEPQFSDISKYRVLSFFDWTTNYSYTWWQKHKAMFAAVHFHSIFFLWGKLVLLSLAEVVFQASSLSNDVSKQNQHFLSKVKSDWIIFD